jgi:hypothetical protein
MLKELLFTFAISKRIWAGSYPSIERSKCHFKYPLFSHRLLIELPKSRNQKPRRINWSRFPSQLMRVGRPIGCINSKNFCIRGFPLAARVASRTHVWVNAKMAPGRVIPWAWMRIRKGSMRGKMRRRCDSEASDYSVTTDCMEKLILLCDVDDWWKWQLDIYITMIFSEANSAVFRFSIELSRGYLVPE